MVVLSNLQFGSNEYKHSLMQKNIIGLKILLFGIAETAFDVSQLQIRQDGSSSSTGAPLFLFRAFALFVLLAKKVIFHQYVHP